MHPGAAAALGWSSGRLARLGATLDFHHGLLALPRCLAPSKIPAMNISRMAGALGRRGGQARSQRLSVAEKKRIASLGGKARVQSLQAARRIAHNFRYAGVLDELRGQPTAIERERAFAGPLPGIYPAGS